MPYSSGMYVRLAIAVASHLEPEILLVDEVLTVGDAAFQKKCLGKMEEAAMVESDNYKDSLIRAPISSRMAAKSGADEATTLLALPSCL